MPGFSVEALTARYFERYDRNGDGAIDLRGPIISQGIRTRSEAAVHSLTMQDARNMRVIAHWNETAPNWIDLSGVQALAMKDSYISSERLFLAADKDGDKTVTKGELGAAIRFYDTDKNDRVEDVELFQLSNDFGETRATVTHRFTPTSTVRVRHGDADDLGPNLLPY